MIALNLLAVAIGIGLFFTLLLSHVFGLAAGGLVVPGYVALQLMNPLNVALTLMAALGAFAVVRLISGYVVVYGRRQTILMILTGYLFAGILDILVGNVMAWADLEMIGEPGAAEARLVELESVLLASIVELKVIGYIIPGLIAIWFDRQGVLQTVCALVVTAVLVRLTLIAIMPETLAAFDAAQRSLIPGW